jgi:uncharacterized membrane protein YdbT with pleckstrin-like domain
MSEAVALPASQDLLGPPERLHPLYLLTGLGQALKGAWGMLVPAAYFASKGSWWIVIVMAVLFAFFSIGSLYLRWLKLEYRVGAHELRIDSGWLSRTSRAIPFDRVASISGLERAWRLPQLPSQPKRNKPHCSRWAAGGS